jgi:hypothetical protein
MAFIPQSSSQGALLELIARGQKDKFFVADNDDSKWAFDNNYNEAPPFISERRTIVPLNQPRFGSSFEVEIDKYGDVLTECAFVIDLPTWYPPIPMELSGNPVNPSIANGLYNIQEDETYNSYGYTNYVGYFLFESIQFYQDQFLIQEWSGDSLFCTQVTEGSWASSFLDQTFAGLQNNYGPGTEALGIAKNATPRRLRVKIPLPGLQTPGDGGFPLVCMPSQNFRFRVKLRPLESLVECSNENVIKPAPWGGKTFTYTMFNTPEPPYFSTYKFKTLDRIQIPEPTILLETSQIYLPENATRSMQESLITIPYRRVFENVFTIGELDYKPLDVSGTIVSINRRLDARHLAERLVYIFKTSNNILRNRLYDFFNGSYSVSNPDRSFYTFSKLVIAGKDRENYNTTRVWRDYQALAKDERDNGLGINSMRWNLGQITGKEAPYSRQPEGTINFSMADRPTLYLQLQNTEKNLITKERNTELRCFIESWCAYEVQQGRGRQLFAS